MNKHHPTRSKDNHPEHVIQSEDDGTLDLCLHRLQWETPKSDAAETCRGHRVNT